MITDSWYRIAIKGKNYALKFKSHLTKELLKDHLDLAERLTDVCRLLCEWIEIKPKSETASS